MALVLAVAVTSVGIAGAGGESTRFEAATAGQLSFPEQSNVTAVSTEVVESDAATSDAVMEKVGDTAREVRPVSGAEERDRAALARRIDYTARSGLDLDWAHATAQNYEGTESLVVPVLGTDIPELSKVVYLATDQGITVVEMVAGMVDTDRAGMRVWEDGTLTKDIVVVNSDAASDGTVVQAGWSFNKFKNCLNNAGIMWATVALVGSICGVACAVTAGVACIYCAAGVLGGNAGVIGTCAAAASR
ncbi:hypothetical protein CHMI_00735 [Cellulomonas hominis]|nr:hypothetical protein CHMI_00735 [Cellulomonas hominis]